MLVKKRVVDTRATGQNIRKLCKNSGMTVEQFRDAVGIESLQACYKWYRGDSLPSIDHLVTMEDIFGMSMSQIIVTNKVDL